MPSDNRNSRSGDDDDEEDENPPTPNPVGGQGGALTASGNITPTYDTRIECSITSGTSRGMSGVMRVLSNFDRQYPC